jgi:DNA-binding protein HU-beta
MKKSEFIEKVAEKAETSKASAARVVEAIFDTASGAIAEAVRAGQDVSIPGFGKFRSKTRAARKGRNPQTGAEIDIPESTVVSFTAGKGLKDSMATSGKGGRKAAAGAKRGGTRAAAEGGAKAAGGGAKAGGGARKGAR